MLKPDVTGEGGVDFIQDNGCTVWIKVGKDKVLSITEFNGDVRVSFYAEGRDGSLTDINEVSI